MLNGKKYTVQIGGESYALVSVMPAEQVECAVACVNNLLQEISDGTVAISLKKAAVLAALKLALELQTLKAAHGQMERTVQKMLTQLE